MKRGSSRSALLKSAFSWALERVPWLIFSKASVCPCCSQCTAKFPPVPSDEKQEFDGVASVGSPTAVTDAGGDSRGQGKICFPNSCTLEWLERLRAGSIMLVVTTTFWATPAFSSAPLTWDFVLMSSANHFLITSSNRPSSFALSLCDCLQQHSCANPPRVCTSRSSSTAKDKRAVLSLTAAFLSV